MANKTDFHWKRKLRPRTTFDLRIRARGGAKKNDGTILDVALEVNYGFLGNKTTLKYPGGVEFKIGETRLPENLVEWIDKTSEQIVKHPAFHDLGYAEGKEFFVRKIGEVLFMHISKFGH